MEMETKRRILTFLTLGILGAALVWGVSSLFKTEAEPPVVYRPVDTELPTLIATGIEETAPMVDIPNTGDTADMQVGVFDTLEMVFNASVSPDNPFDTYLLKLEVKDPNGRTFTVEGFFDGDGKGGQNGKVWKVRLNPYQAGQWTWRTVQGDARDQALENLSGQFQAVDIGNLGGIVADGKYFRFQNGGPVYLAGNFLDFTDGLRTTHTFMSETTSDGQRDAILNRQKDFHSANKANIYFANKGDYDNQSVTPWLGSASSNDKTRMDVARWKKYDEYLSRFKKNRMFAEMWFFADDSNFGGLSKEHKNRLARYAMARTSAYSHTLYVLALEWQEGWSKDSVSAFGQYVQAHNPWGRVVSVHSLTQTDWAFSGEDWANFFASQAGNESGMDEVSSFSVEVHNSETVPHMSEEFGILEENSSTNLRNRLWATFAGGAAGSGTGSDLNALLRFIEQSHLPFQRMKPANNLVNDGGNSRFLMAEEGHHYLVYSANGGFTLNVSGNGMKGYWFNPRSAGSTLSGPFDVSSGNQTFTPPSNADQDWVLWITDGSNLNQESLYPTPGQNMITIPVKTGAGDPQSGGPLNFRMFLPFTAGA